MSFWLWLGLLLLVGVLAAVWARWSAGLEQRVREAQDRRWEDEGMHD